jgi:hypothetical protein
MRTPLILLASALLAACASMGADQTAPQIPANAVETSHTEANGDVVSEYRVGGQVRMIRVQPSRGPAYYLIDKGGRIESTDANVSPVYFKLFGW